MYEIFFLFRVMNSVPVMYVYEIFWKKIVWVRKFLTTLWMGTKKRVWKFHSPHTPGIRNERSLIKTIAPNQGHHVKL